MKKDRNMNYCPGGYPPYGGMPGMPGMPNPMPPTDGNNMYGTIEHQLVNMQQQINMLDERVSKLEGKPSPGYTNKYSDSNYYML